MDSQGFRVEISFTNAEPRESYISLCKGESTKNLVESFLSFGLLINMLSQADDTKIYDLSMQSRYSFDENLA